MVDVIEWMMKLSLQAREYLRCNYYYREDESLIDFDDGKTWSSNLWIEGKTQKLDLKDDGTVVTASSSIFSGIF
jgi:hypothetical protein